MSNQFYNQFLRSGNFAVEFYVAAGLTQNYALAYPESPPAAGQSLRWDGTNNKFQWFTPSQGNAGTVTSVGLILPTDIFNVTNSPITGAGDLTASLKQQVANTVFAAPNGTAGAPVFRSLVNADIPTGIDAAKITGVLQRSNIPNGTAASTFQLANAVTLGNTNGNLSIFGADGATLADLYARNIFVTGQIETQNTTTVNLGDNLLYLNANFTTGTPTVDAGFSVRRGSLTNSSFLWDETNDRFVAGLDDNKLPVDRWATVGITNANISNGSYTFTHNLKKQFPSVVVTDNSNRRIMLNVTYTDANSCVIDFSRTGTLSGTWNITAS